MWVPVIVVFAMAAALMDQERGVRTWLRQQEELAAAKARIAAISADIETQKALVEALTGDSFAIERAIREELRYARPDETVVRLRPLGLATPRNH